MIIHSLVIANLLYLLLFDHLPSELRLMLAGGVGVGYIVMSIVAVYSRPSAGLVVMGIGTALVLMPWGLGSIIDPFEPMRSQTTPDAALRYAVAAMASIAILRYWREIPSHFVVGVIAVTLVYAVGVAIVSPPASLGEAEATRFAPFTGTPLTAGVAAGGTEGLHSSGYVVALQLLVVTALWRSGQITTRVAAPMMALALILVLGYQVRTTWVLLAAFAITSLILRMTETRSGALLALSIGSIALASGAFAMLLIISFMGWDELVEFSSGRMGTYIDRMFLLQNRSTTTLLIGSGPGSDVVYSSVWWWEAKNSHNDFLTSLIEAGIVGLVGRILFLIGMVMHSGRWALPFVVAIAASSMISNALFGRSMIMPVMFVALAATTRPRPDPVSMAPRAALARASGGSFRGPLSPMSTKA